MATGPWDHYRQVGGVPVAPDEVFARGHGAVGPSQGSWGDGALRCPGDIREWAATGAGHFEATCAAELQGRRCGTGAALLGKVPRPALGVPEGGADGGVALAEPLRDLRRAQ